MTDQTTITIGCSKEELVLICAIAKHIVVATEEKINSKPNKDAVLLNQENTKMTRRMEIIFGYSQDFERFCMSMKWQEPIYNGAEFVDKESCILYDPGSILDKFNLIKDFIKTLNSLDFQANPIEFYMIDTSVKMTYSNKISFVGLIGYIVNELE